MRNGHSPTTDVAASFTPCYRVWMSPYPLALSSEEKIGVELISRDWIALRGLRIISFSGIYKPFRDT